MFSLEKTIEEITTFVKNFFRTIYYTFFHSPDLFEPNANHRLIRPSLYMAICMFFCFGFQNLNPALKYSGKLNKVLDNYLRFYEKSAIENHLLYVLPLALILWALVTGVCEVLHLGDFWSKVFKRVIFYWIGNGFLLATVNSIFWAIINNYPFDAGGATGKIIDISINILPRLYFCAPVIIILIIIVLKRSSITISIWFRLLSMPAILFLALFYSLNLTSIVADFMDASEKTLEVYSEDGDKRFKITKNCVDSCQKVALSTRIFFKNMGKSDFFIRKDVDTLTLTELRKDENDTSAKTINFKLNKIDEDPKKEIRVLKTGETCILDYLDTVSAKEWQFWWEHTLPAKHLPGVKGRFEYITTWTEVGSFFYNEEVEITQTPDTIKKEKSK